MIVKTRKRPVVRLRLTPEMAGALMSPAEFDAIEDYEEGWRYELVHGVLVVAPLSHESQVGANERLGHRLLSFKFEHAEGQALDETLPERYIRTRTSRRLADRVIWAGLGRRPKPHQDVPAIAVEFVSAGKRNRQRDYEDKRTEYLEVGVKEYWVIDRFERTLTVFRAKSPKKKVVVAGHTYASPLLPGFVLPLDELLAVADRWAESEAAS